MPSYKIGPARLKFLAYSLGSTDGTVKGVANKFDRRRLEALMRFEQRELDALKIEDELSNASAADVNAERQRAERWNYDQLKRPALLRAGAAELLNPWVRHD